METIVSRSISKLTRYLATKEFHPTSRFCRETSALATKIIISCDASALPSAKVTTGAMRCSMWQPCTLYQAAGAATASRKSAIDLPGLIFDSRMRVSSP